MRIILKTIEKELFPTQPYLQRLYLALYATAYYRLFRMSELISGDHPVQVRDVHIADNKNKLMFVLHTSKTHWTDQKPQVVKISATPATLPKYQMHSTRSTATSDYCPYELLRNFLAVRSGFTSHTEPFFVFKDKGPVCPRHM